MKGSSNLQSIKLVGPGVLRFLTLRNGLEAAFILLSIMAAPGIDRRVISEDYIESCIMLLRHHLLNNLLPTMNNVGHIDSSNRSASADETTPPTKKARLSNAITPNLAMAKEIKKVYKPITTSIPLLAQVFEAMENLVFVIQMDDQPLITLSSAALSVFSLEANLHIEQCKMLQVSSIGLLTAICRCHPKSRSILAEDIFPFLLKVSTSKRPNRTFSVPLPPKFSPQYKLISVREDNSIHPISVLLVSLIQSCVTFPSCKQKVPELGLPTQKSLPETLNGSSINIDSGLSECQVFCEQFVGHLLQRCSKKGEDGGASEFRPILMNLVDDFLVMQFLPEFPAAEMILVTISRSLVKDIFQASSSNKNLTRNASLSLETTYLAAAFDIIGKIGAHVAAILASQRDKPLDILRQPQVDTGEKVIPGNVNSCFCGRSSFVDTLMVRCDFCRGFFHGECVGQNRSMLEEKDEWICDDCNLRDLALDTTKSFLAIRGIRFEGGESIPEIIETHIFRQLILAYISNCMDITPGGKYAHNFLLAQWIHDLDHDCNKDVTREWKALSQQFLDLWDRPLANPLSTRQAAITLFNRDGYHRLMIAMTARKSYLVSSFPRHIGLLIQFMADDAFVSVRKLAVKALSYVVGADSRLMLHPALKSAVCMRFSDEAKSVREAVVGLVGSYVVSCPELANAFHSAFLERLLDEGVSVKKRTVKIFRDILMTNPNYHGRAEACALMMRRAADSKEDDSVRDIIHELFSELWLGNIDIQSHAKKLAFQEGMMTNSKSEGFTKKCMFTPVVSPDKVFLLKSCESSPDIRCRIAAEQMIDVVQFAGSNEMIIQLLQELLSGFSDIEKDCKRSNRKRKKLDYSSHCSGLVDSMAEYLLLLEENREVEKNLFGNKVIATFHMIGAMAHVAPLEVCRHMITFLPYLKADNRISVSQECDVICEICSILSVTCSSMTRREVLFLANSSLSHDLSTIIYRMGRDALASAVKTLCDLASHPSLEDENIFLQKALSIVTTFYGYLHKNSHLANEINASNKKTKSNVYRALSVLGCICRSQKVENHDISWINEDLKENRLMETENVNWDTMVEACYRTFLLYLNSSDMETKCASMKALEGIFTSRPRILLAMQQAGKLEALMNPESETELQLQALRCWREILVAEEKRIESGEAKAKMESNRKITVSKKISGDQDSDATLIGAVLTCYSHQLQEMTKSKNELIRYASVDLISHLLRQGLLNPFQTIPYLFGLQGDIDSLRIREFALKLLILEGEKRPDMLRQRVCAGIKSAFMFQRSLYPGKRVTAAIEKEDGSGKKYECIFSSVFKESIRSSMKQRQGLFMNLLSLFETGENIKDSKKKFNHFGIPLLAFAAEVLAYLPYNTANDPLFIIYHIQAATALYGGQHLDSLINFLQNQGFPLDVNDENQERDPLELAATAQRPSGTKQAQLLRKKSFDLSRFQALCETSSSFILLLRLKSYLRMVYNLSETRCIVFSPDVADRSADKIASNIRFSRFDSVISGYENGDFLHENEIAYDCLILQYAEFRKLMRHEQALGSKMIEADDDSIDVDDMSNQ
jgi:cohesin loading factor subunit SCC2